MGGGIIKIIKNKQNFMLELKTDAFKAHHHFAYFWLFYGSFLMLHREIFNVKIAIKKLN